MIPGGKDWHFILNKTSGEDSTRVHEYWKKTLTDIHGYLEKKKKSKSLKIFISYAEEETPNKEDLQKKRSWLKDSFQMLGCKVLDRTMYDVDISKSIKRDIEVSDVYIVMLTSAYDLQRQNSKSFISIEYQEILEKVESKSKKMHPLLIYGDTAINEKLTPHLVRDFRRWELADVSLLRESSCRALIPSLFGIEDSDSEYNAFVDQYQLEQATRLPPENKDFVGRLELLEKLKDSFLQGNITAITPDDKINVISGLGGIGKTQLALAYAYKSLEKYCMIRWLPSEGGALSRSLRKLAEDLGIFVENEEKYYLEQLKNRLKEKGNILLIYDNVDNKNESSISMFSQLPQVHCLITTRLGDYGEGNPLPLSVFTEDDANTYIRSRLSKKRKDIETKEDIKKLASELGNFPLALAQAVAYIIVDQIAIKKYLSLYKDNLAELLGPEEDKRLPKQKEQYPSSLMVTLKMSLEKLKNEKGGMQSIDLLCYLSLLNPDNIHETLLDTIPGFEREKDLHDSIRKLLAYSFIDETGPEQYKIHRLLQAVVREEEKLKIKEKYCVLIECIYSKLKAFEELNFSSWKPAEIVIPHAVILWNLRENFDLRSSDSETLRTNLAELCIKIFCYERLKARYKIAEQFAEELTKFLENLPIEKQPTLLKAKLYHEQGMLLYNIGNYGQAREQYESSMKLFNDLGLDLENNINQAYIVQILISILKRQSNPSEIAITIEEIKNRADQVKKAFDSLISGDASNGNNEYNKYQVNFSFIQMNILALEKSYKVAKELCEKTLKRCEEIYGTEAQHPQIATALHNLGSYSIKDGSYENAKECLNKSIAIKEAVYGQTHPFIAASLHGLGEVAYKEKNYLRSIFYYNKSMEMYNDCSMPEKATEIEKLKELQEMVASSGASASSADTTSESSIDEKCSTSKVTLV